MIRSKCCEIQGWMTNKTSVNLKSVSKQAKKSKQRDDVPHFCDTAPNMDRGVFSAKQVNLGRTKCDVLMRC